jgi:6-phosphogluconolactonase
MISIFKTDRELGRAAAEFIFVYGKLCIKHRERFDLVLSGGKTPEETFFLLAHDTKSKENFWQSTHLWWGDERCVSPDDEMSNYRMARKNLIDIVNLPDENIHRIQADTADTRQAAALYSDEFPAEPDLIILGIGSDGHTASLFPRSAALDEKQDLFVPSQALSGPVNRITMTPVALSTAKNTLVLAVGENKMQAIEKVFHEEGDIHDTPARLVSGATWFVDEDAAGDIEKLIGQDESHPLIEKVK